MVITIRKQFNFIDKWKRSEAVIGNGITPSPCHLKAVINKLLTGKGRPFFMFRPPDAVFLYTILYFFIKLNTSVDAFDKKPQGYFKRKT